MEPEELDALHTSHADEFTEEELGAITKVSEEEGEGGSDEEEDGSRSKPMVKFLSEIFQDMKSITERPLDANPVIEQYLTLKRGLDDVMLPYKELHRNLRQFSRQLSITDFFHPGPSSSGA